MSNPIIWIVMPRTGTYTYYIHPSIHIWHYSSFWAHGLLQKVSPFFCTPARLLQPRIRRICNASFCTTPCHLVVGFSTYLFMEFPMENFFFLRSFLLPFLGTLTTDTDHCSSWKARQSKSQNFMKAEGRVFAVFTRAIHLFVSWER